MHFDGTMSLLQGVAFDFQTRYSTDEPLFFYSVLDNVKGHTSHAVVKLNPSHPVVDTLLEEAEVGRERLEGPLLRVVKSDYLASGRGAMNDACRENGVSLERLFSSLVHFELQELSLHLGLVGRV